MKLAFGALALALAAIGLAVSAVVAGDGRIHYPETRRGDQVDDYHGTKVADPFRWLEEDVRKSDEVRAWVEAQNKITFAYLRSIPERLAIRRRLTELWNFVKYTPPSKAGGRYFFQRNDGLQNQFVLYVLDRLGGEPRVLLDPNKLSKDGTVALSGTTVSKDGKYLAYGLAEAGSDWHTWHVRNVATAKDLPDQIRWIKWSPAAWTADGKGFFYGRYAEPKKGAEFQAANRNNKLYYHRLGTPQADDVLVYQRPDHPNWDFLPEVTEDGRFLIITIFRGTDAKYRVAYRDLAEPYAMPVDLIDTFKNEYTFIANDGPVFYFKTDRGAPRGRMIAIDTRKPAPPDWKEIIPEAKESLQGVSLVGNLFIARYLKDAHSQVKLFAPDGRLVREVPLPGLGTADGFRGKRSDTQTFYAFSSYNTPPSIYRYDLLTGKNTLYKKPKVKFNPEDYEVTQVFYPSKDGTKVPLFITHRKGLERDSSHATLLYGYGGFAIPMTPRFSTAWLGWLDMGGVLAVANLRGGAEYGEAWHLAGKRAKKQNVFDDFIAAAEYLIKEGYTRRDKLAIQGGSNGGLLVGAVMVQRPDLFGACLPAVGVMDMLRFHKFTAGRYWVDEYGLSDNPADFQTLYAYSPYHAILRNGKRKYPATLITTGDHDDRVVPGHSFKFAAALQANQAGDAPLLIRIETRAGHGAGKPTAKLIAEVADEWAFLVKNLKMKLARP
jgi:prolyl oligopeptidase